MSELLVREAGIQDSKTLLKFITDLAIYEKAEHEVLATIETIEASLLTENSHANALICELDGVPVGSAIYFYNYSTWLAKPGLFLEDLYVSPEYRMTLISAVALFFAMLVSALIPGPSVMAGVSRSIVTGVSHGLAVVLGVLIADFIFICIALSGLMAVSSLLGELAIYIKYVGATYLIWLAYLTWKAKAATDEISGPKNTKLKSNGIAGFFIGISNPKAILFYMGF